MMASKIEELKQTKVAKTGNEAVAEAMRQINPDVVAAYPITPQTEIAQIFASFVADGVIDTEFVAVESEHSAMSACVGASAAGARVMTATSSQGLALMAEILPIASALRLPIVMTDVNRALSGPINIHCDHSDTMMVRDSGWIQIFSENAQEAYDNVIQAVRIAEDPRVKLPVMVTMDGFVISHGMETVLEIEDRAVKDFVGEFKPSVNLLDLEHPITLGGLDLQDYYFEHKRQVAQAMIDAQPVILEIGREFGAKFNRGYSLFESYRLEDAELAIVVMGSTAGTTKAVIDSLRGRGVAAGLLKLRVFRPFPYRELAEALSKIPAVAVLDRSDTFSSFGAPLFTEIRACLYDEDRRPRTINYIYGLGGRDITIPQIEKVYADLQAALKSGSIAPVVRYLGLRE